MLAVAIGDFPEPEHWNDLNCLGSEEIVIESNSPEIGTLKETPAPGAAALDLFRHILWRINYISHSRCAKLILPSMALAFIPRHARPIGIRLLPNHP